MGFDARAHAFAVVEAVNRARTNPPEYANALAASLSGCYSGQTFTPPWGGRLKTEEGEANLLELLQQMREMPPRPALRLLHPLSEAAITMPKRTEPNPAGSAEEQKALHALKKALSANMTRVTDLLHKWDVDGDGQISVSELQRALAGLCIAIDKKAVQQAQDSGQPPVALGPPRLELHAPFCIIQCRTEQRPS